MFYIPLTNNKVAVKIATCLFLNGKVELISYNNGNTSSRDLV